MGLRIERKGVLSALGGALLVAAGCGGDEAPIDYGSKQILDGSVVTADSGYSWNTDAAVWSADTGTYVPGEGDVVALPPGSAVPANVCDVLKNNGCTNCHSDPVAGGARMPLTQRAHFMGQALDGSPMAQKVLARITDTAKPMPPPTSQRPLPSAADVATLKAWFDSGMPGADGGPCGASSSPVTPVIPGERFPGEVPSPPPPPGTPSWAIAPWPEKCDEVVTMEAHGGGNVPYNIPTDETYYQCFYKKVPWPAGKRAQIVAARARFVTPDDKAFVHHLVVSSIEFGQVSVAGGSAVVTDGGQGFCPNPSGSTVGIWAPGALNPVAFPSDVGVKAPAAGAFFEMQVHFNNPTHATGKKSKVAYDMCITYTPRANEAGVHWLGFENTGVGTLTGLPSPPLDNKGNGVGAGQCTAKQRARILWLAPHMHEQGMHTKMEIVRKNGQRETILDQPFNFEEQTAYTKDNLWIEQGEVIRSQCKWRKSPVYFGFASEDEMCFIYTLAYPIGALAGKSFIPGTGGETGFVGGELSCAGQAAP